LNFLDFILHSDRKLLELVSTRTSRTTTGSVVRSNTRPVRTSPSVER